MSRLSRVALALLAAAFAVRVVRSRQRRFMHPDGRSFTGTLEIYGAGDRTGSTLLDHPATYCATVRLSKGIGTRRGWADVRGLAMRVHLAGRDLDLLLSTAGHGRITRHIPAPRRTFDATYGTITAYRTTSHAKVYITAHPDPGATAPGRDLDAVTQGNRFDLETEHGDRAHSVGRVSLEHALPPEADAALAFDPVRNSLHDLHPTGLVHGVRALAYRASQRWRGAAPVAPNPEAVARTSAHR